jgi:hypothetical protein
MKKLLSLFALLGLLAVTASAEKIDLGSGKALLFTLPQDWTGAGMPARQPGMSEPGQNARYVTKNGSNDAVLITILPVPDDRFSDAETLKAMAEMATQQFVAGSVEGKVDLKETRFGGLAGFTTTFTDASLVGKPSVKDDYKALTSCFVYLGDRMMLTATLFTDDLNGSAYAEGMRLLKSISLQLPKDKI